MSEGSTGRGEGTETCTKTAAKVMRLWRTDLEVMTEAGTAQIRIQFRRGLFQGDALSPLIFVLAVALLSSFLRIAGGYSVAHYASPVTHLLFMDDLKVFEESKAEVESTLEVAERLARAVGMSLVARKCAVATASV